MDEPKNQCHFCLAARPPGTTPICNNCATHIRAMAPKERMEIMNGFWQAIELRRQTEGLNAASLAHKLFAEDLRDLIELAKASWRDGEDGDNPLGWEKFGRG
jgi:hypothetical protein